MDYFRHNKFVMPNPEGQYFNPIEQKPASKVGEYDLTSEDDIRTILEEGTDEEMKALREFHKLTAEKIDLFRHYARLRKEVLEQGEKELADRIKDNLKATEKELSMGAYNENIEPHVRASVLNLRDKGYCTYESGFSGFDSQKISFENDYLIEFEFPRELADELKNKGVAIKMKPNSIGFVCEKELRIEELEEIWEKIERVFPEMSEKVEPCTLPQAESFRKKQFEIEK